MLKKIFLTGSTGYLGTKFVDLYGNNFDLFAVSRGDKKHSLDLLNAEKLKELFIQFSPDVIVHLAADTGRDIATSSEIEKTNPAVVQNLIDLALPNKTPFIFTSTEALYGGKEHEGDYLETDEYKPRTPYGASKVASEKLLIASGLPYLITRGHRHVGISNRFHRKKWFPDTLNDLVAGREVHLDSKKIFNPVLINNICDIITYHINHNLDKKIILNMGVDKKTTYYTFIIDVAKVLHLDTSLIHDDGDEVNWLANSSISIS